MSNKPSVLFICQHNSGRSQMAEAYLNRMADGTLHIESAELDPAKRVNPLVVQVMKEEGFDLSTKKPQRVFDLFKTGRLFSHVITVCYDFESKCPVFPGITKRWHWPFPDPAKVTGSEAEKLKKVREIRGQIKRWLSDPPEGGLSFKGLISE